MKRLGLVAIFAMQVVLSATNQVPSHVESPATNAPRTTAVGIPCTQPLVHVRCEATTKSGKRCSRRAAPGERFCRQHLKLSRRLAP